MDEGEKNESTKSKSLLGSLKTFVCYLKNLKNENGLFNGKMKISLSFVFLLRTFSKFIAKLFSDQTTTISRVSNFIEKYEVMSSVW